MRFEVLGTLRVLRQGQDVTPPGRMQRTLLAVLLVHANHVVSTDVLTDALWGEQGRASNLHLHVHRLRRILDDPERLTFTPGGYQLAVAPGEFDAEQFDSVIDEAGEVSSQDPQRSVNLIRGALDAWRGTPFDRLDVPVLTDEASRLSERRLAAIEELYTAELACGRHTLAANELPELIREHPLRERLHGLLMTALYRGGQQARALAAYRAARRMLVDELGQEPGPELRRVEQLILAGEPVELGLLAQAQQAPVPEQLPHDVRAFSGREAELSALDIMLTTTTGTALISAVAGTGGIGKTALAVHWAHRVRDRFPDGQLYIDLRGYGPEPPMPPKEALAALLRGLDVDSNVVPADLAERANLFRTLVAERRMLILLDNARTADQVRPLLPGGSTCVVVVTSRDSLAGLVARDGAHRIVLDPLPHPDARRLLQELAGRHRIGADPGAVDLMIERCARLPLALRIAAELIKSRPRLSIGDLADELTDERRTLDVLDAGRDPHTAVRVVFSWSYRGLPPEAAHLFRLLGVHPGHDIDTYALAALAGTRPDEVRRLMSVLTRAYLVAETAPGRYQAHDLLRAYAADLANHADGETERDAALDRMIGYYLHTTATATDALGTRSTVVPLPEPPACDAAVPAFPGPDEALRWLNAERANLIEMARYSVRHAQPYTAIHLSSLLFRHLQTSAHHDDALTIHHAALTAARTQNDRLAEGNAHRYIGAAHYRQGNVESAWEHGLRAYQCYQLAGDVRFIRVHLGNLGLTSAWGRSNYSEALRYFTEGLRLCSETTDDHSLAGRVFTLFSLGKVRTVLGDHAEAMRNLTDALTLVEHAECHKGDIYASLGALHSRLGHYQEAKGYLEQAWAMARDAQHPIEEAGVYPLGFVYWQLGHREDAFACVEHCLDSARRAHDALRQAEILNELGRLHLLDDAPSDALLHHRIAFDLAVSIGKRHEQANAHAGIGDVNHALGDLATARTHWRLAREIYRDLGTPEAVAMQQRLDTASASPTPSESSSARPSSRAADVVTPGG